MQEDAAITAPFDMREPGPMQTRDST